MSRYKGKTAVVIGGTHGMGRAIVDALVRDGAQVVATGRDERNVARSADQLGDNARVIQSDVTDLRAIDALGDELERTLGHLDAAFINAGVATLEPFQEVTEASYDRQFAVNAKGAFFTTQRLIPVMRTGGAIVLTTSIANGTGTAGMSVYSGAKAAARSFAQVLAAELVTRDIRVNCVSPGFISTPTAGMADAPPELRAEFEAIGDAITPMKRHGTVEEVARAALFLAFEATFTTGAELIVDGGLTTIDTPQSQ